MKTTIGLFLLFTTAASALPTKSLDLTKVTSSIEFLAVGTPSMLKIRGKVKGGSDAKPLEGTLVLEGEKLTGTAKFGLDTLETGISLRDRHMKEKYLETAKFPKAELAFSDFKLTPELQKGDGEASKVPFKGKLTIHGVPQEVSGLVDIKKKGSDLSLAFTFSTKITAHGIPSPGFMGVTVAEEVEISVKVEGPLT